MITILNDNYIKLEDRKLESQRREMTKAYKRSSTFMETSKNPALSLIKGLMQSDKESPRNLNSNHSTDPDSVPDFKQAELEIVSTGENEDFESNRFSPIQSAFDPNNFSNFDLFTNNSIHQDNVKNSINGNDQNKQFEFKDFNIVEPGHFLLNENRTIKDTVFRKDVQKGYINRKFQKAISTYMYQMKMAESGFSLGQSKYIITV